jgi:hypothetical protein
VPTVLIGDVYMTIGSKCALCSDWVMRCNLHGQPHQSIYGLRGFKFASEPCCWVAQPNSRSVCPLCSGELHNKLFGPDSNAETAASGQQRILPPAQERPEEPVALLTSEDAMQRAPGAWQLSWHTRRPFDAPPPERPRPLHALARQGRRILALCDAARREEAAVSSSKASQPWWQTRMPPVWRRQPVTAHEHGQQPNGSARVQPEANQTWLWRAGSPRLPPPGTAPDRPDAEKFTSIHLCIAHGVLDDCPGLAFLQPDPQQVQTAAVAAG